MDDLHKPFNLLILGASGVFGSRLAKLAAQEAGIALTLAARGLSRLEEVAAELDGDTPCVALDRDAITAHDLAEFDLVVDAAGPFQSSQMQVVESVIAAAVPYLDLADGRDFIATFPRFDEIAQGAGIPLITGASSIPALSHAVLDRMVTGWQEIDHIRIGIYPGNRAPRGLSVVKAILSYVGKSVCVFRQGRWQDISGWGMTHREYIPQIGKRWASVCDTPEQDLLVARYSPTQSAEFFAGLELSVLHLGLAAFAQPVRWGWVKSLAPIARPMLAIAKWFLPFGSDSGAMTVRADGKDAGGRDIQRLFVLKADTNRGPYVPVLAALAMIRRFRDGELPPAGAYACSGILDLNDFEGDMQKLGMEWWIVDTPSELADGANTPAGHEQNRAGGIDLEVASI